jgi:hypothetical protein
MRNFILFLAILCAAASFMFSTAAKEAPDGPNWASSVCSSARMFCHDPMQLAYGAAGLVALWIVLAFVSAIRG